SGYSDDKESLDLEECMFCFTIRESFPNSRLTADLSLKVFGCTVFVHVHNRSKREPRDKKCVFGEHHVEDSFFCDIKENRRQTNEELDITINIDVRDLGGDMNKHDPNDEKGSNLRDVMDLNDLNDKNSDIEPIDPLNDKNKNKNGEQTKEIQVYSRRNRTQDKRTKDSQQCQKSIPQDLNGIQGNLPTDSIFNSFSELDLPIAKCKGVRNAPKYLISMLVSYKKLSPSYSAFTSQIPKPVQDALQVPEWKKAILEELRALEKNET
ncbi:hypothetical protein T459_01894, partial [Capsicum annuum]